jgi:hypothetical protein
VGLRAWLRVLSAVAFLVAGLAETLGATGLVILVSPDTRWGPGTHTLALGGMLQMAAAALLASGRKTRWALGILLGYVSLGSIFGNLPQVLDSKVGGSALAALVVNLAVIGGLLYWLHLERTPDWRALPPQAPTKERLATSRPRLPSRGVEIQPASDVRRQAAG